MSTSAFGPIGAFPTTPPARLQPRRPGAERFAPPGTDDPLSRSDPAATDDAAASATRGAADDGLALLVAERAALEVEIRTERDRLRTAEAGASLHSAAVQAELDATVLAVERELVALETEHRAVLAAIWDSARAEATRLRDRAQDDAAAIRATTASLAARLHGT